MEASYATLYGDMAGRFAPLRTVSKHRGLCPGEISNNLEHGRRGPDYQPPSVRGARPLITETMIACRPTGYWIRSWNCLLTRIYR
jgi:hypothetical protein